MTAVATTMEDEMSVIVRRGVTADGEAAGRICYEAFKAIAEAHNFPPDLPYPEMGIGFVSMLLGHPGFFGAVAEIDGRVVGSNFLDERNPISGVGPITVDPAVQDDGIGRLLMKAVMDRSAERGFPGIRLVQAGYHRRSLALYLKLGFEVREPLLCLQGPPIARRLPGFDVRSARVEDMPDCNRLCFRVHGHDRAGELADAVGRGVATIVERAGRITGYATEIAFFAHAVAETDEDLEALVAAAAAIGGPGILVPARNGELVRWCFAQGLRIQHTMTLMTIGLYNEPRGAWLPSVLY
jgi:GNAT superfamily N-acetyltransferase